MDINDLFLTVKYIANKNAQGYITSTEFNKILLPNAQRDYQNYLLGLIQSFQQGRPIAPVEIGGNEIIMQKLSPFVSAPTQLNIDGTGGALYPNNYIYPYAMFTDDMANPISWITASQLASYTGSVIDPIANNPVYLILNSKFQFYPITLVKAKLIYVRTPVDGVWGYVTETNGREVYSVDLSTQIEWMQNDYSEIIARVLRQVGVNLSAQQVIQYAEEIKSKGT